MNTPQRIFDLSQPVFANCPQYPDVNPRPAQISRLYTRAVQGVNKEIVELSTHTGTHCDAPYHFFDDGASIDQMPLETFIGRASVLDLRGKAPGSAIERSELECLAPRINTADVVLLNTGWGQKRANTKRFLTEYIYLSGEGARYLVERGIKGVGIDAVSLGGYNDMELAAPPHQTMLASGVFIVEDLVFPDEIMDGAERLFLAVPIKLQGASGAWTRAMLWEG